MKLISLESLILLLNDKLKLGIIDKDEFIDITIKYTKFFNRKVVISDIIECYNNIPFIKPEIKVNYRNGFVYSENIELFEGRYKSILGKEHLAPNPFFKGFSPQNFTIAKDDVICYSFKNENGSITFWLDLYNDKNYIKDMVTILPELSDYAIDYLGLRKIL